MAETHQVALVTGAATGVGRACAVKFAEAGFDVLVNYSRSESEAGETRSLVEQTGRAALMHQCDVSSDEHVRAMIDRVNAEFGRLDVLVNNAGTTYFIEHQELDEMTEEKWDRILAVNLKGPFFVTRAAAPLLKKSPGAAVVNVSSVAGIAGQGSSIAYCASKGALNTMTKSLARALALKSESTLCVPVRSIRAWMQAWKSDEEVQQMVSSYPLPRAAQPDDIADAVIYLATGTSLTTGQCLVVDGGRTM